MVDDRGADPRVRFGQPWTTRLGYDFNGDGKNSDRPAGVGRNTNDGPKYKNISLRLTKRHRLQRLRLPASHRRRLQPGQLQELRRAVMSPVASSSAVRRSPIQGGGGSEREVWKVPGHAAGAGVPVGIEVGVLETVTPLIRLRHLLPAGGEKDSRFSRRLLFESPSPCEAGRGCRRRVRGG